MLPPSFPESKRPRFRSEREYREWQLALRNTVPVKRHKNTPGLLARLASVIRLAPARQPDRCAEPRVFDQREAHQIRG